MEPQEIGGKKAKRKIISPPRMRAPQKTGGKQKQKERRRHPSTRSAATSGKFLCLCFGKYSGVKYFDKYDAWPTRCVCYLENMLVVFKIWQIWCGWPLSTRCATSDSIKAAFMAACEVGNLEKVFNLNHQYKYQIPNTIDSKKCTNTIDINDNHTIQS